MIKKYIVILMLMLSFVGCQQVVFGSITSESNRETLASGDGSTTEFTFSFPIETGSSGSHADLEVWLRTTSTGDQEQQTETTHYSVSATNNIFSSGGTVTFVTAPPSTVKVLLIRDTSMKQNSNIGASGVTKAIQDALDKLAKNDIDQQEEIDRCYKSPKTDATTLSTQQANSVERANGRFAYNDVGEPIIVTTDIQGAAATAFGVTLIQAADANAGRVVLEIDTDGSPSSINVYNVLNYGAVADDSNDDTAAFNSAILAAFNDNGSDVYVPNGTYNFTSTTGTVTLPGDDGTVNATYGTAMTAETTNTMPYSILLKQGVALLGESYQGTLLKGDWTYGTSDIDTDEKILIQLQTGDLSHMQIRNIRVQDALIGVYHEGIFAQGRIKDLLIQNCGFNIIIDRAERSEFDHIMSTGSGANIVIGGGWFQRNNQATHSPDKDYGGYADKCVFSRIDNFPMRSYGATEIALDAFFDTYFFKAANSATITDDTTLAFNDNGANPDTITDSGSGFVTAGFIANQNINVINSASNDDTYTIDTVVAGTITLVTGDSLTNEGTGSGATVAGRGSLPTDGGTTNYQQRVSYKGVVQTGISIFGRQGRSSFNNSFRDITHGFAARYSIYGGSSSGWFISNINHEKVGVGDAADTALKVFGITGDVTNPYIDNAKIAGLIEVVNFGNADVYSTITTVSSAATKIIQDATGRSTILGVQPGIASGSSTSLTITTDLPQNSFRQAKLTETQSIAIGTSATANPVGSLLYLTKASAGALYVLDVYSTTAVHKPEIRFRKSKSATQGTATTTTTGHIMGLLNFQGVRAGSAIIGGATIEIEQVGTVGSRVPAKMTFETSSTNAVNTNQLVLETNGSVTAAFGVQTSAVARAANTAHGGGTSVIVSGTGFVSVTSTNADFIVVLPAAVIGNEIQLYVGSNGFELQTPDASSPTINDVDCSGGDTNEAAIPADTLSVVTCTAANKWILINYTKLGAVTAAIVPNGI